MFKRLIFLIVLVTVAACTPNQQQEAPPFDLLAPQPIAPVSDIEFVQSDIELAWEWKALEPHQIFVLRLWFEEDEPQEIWLEETAFNAQEMIDSISQEFGAFHWSVAVVNRNDDGGFESMGSEWSATHTLSRVRRLSLEPIPEEVRSEMARYVAAQEFETRFDQFNFLRDFVHTNTNITQQLSYEADYADAMQQIFEHYQGASEAPQLYCDGMTTGMLTVFRELGIESRLVYLYGAVPGYISQHTTLEIFNPETQRWEVHDPTFNVYFIDTKTNERATIERLIFGDLDTINGCDTNGDCNRDKLKDSLEQYLGAVRYGYTPEVWVNPDRIDISQRISGLENNNFPEFVARMTGFQQRDIIFRFDIWQIPPENES